MSFDRFYTEYKSNSDIIEKRIKHTKQNYIDNMNNLIDPSLTVPRIKDESFSVYSPESSTTVEHTTPSFNIPIVFNNPQQTYENLLSIDIEDLLKQQNITSINGKKIKFGDRNIRTWGNPSSWHRQRDPNTGYASARDISIEDGTIDDYNAFRTALLNNPIVRQWMQQKGWGIINEITPEILALTKGTGMHFHFGKDTWANNTWNAWLNNPTVDITTNFRKT